MTLNVYSQGIKRVNTTDLIPISEKFGLDSALYLSGGSPIYRIDSLTALQLLQKMTNYKRYTPSEYFFNKMAQHWNNKTIKEKTEKLATQQLNDICLTKRNEYDRLILLDDKLIISIIKQNVVEIEPQLIKCYDFCDSLGNSLRNNYPSFFKRITKAFTVETFTVIEDYKASQENCYKIMRLLGEIENDYFDIKKLRHHKSNLRPYERDKDIFRFEDHYGEYDSVIVNLICGYTSIDELDFNKEPELEKLVKGFEEEKCWKFILQNEKKGFLDLGCQFAPLAGFGVKYKLVLIENNKLLIMKIGEWIS